VELLPTSRDSLYVDKHQRALRKFGKRVRALRKEQGWSQEYFADLATLDRSYMGCIERGEQNPSFINISRIAAAFGLTISKLCDGI
jgi:transcriptional regulator with XRE-family HTH domain